VLERLRAALASALNTDAATRAFNAMGFKPGEGGSDGLRQRIAEDMRLFTAVIGERNLKFD